MIPPPGGQASSARCGRRPRRRRRSPRTRDVDEEADERAAVRRPQGGPDLGAGVCLGHADQCVARRRRLGLDVSELLGEPAGRRAAGEGDGVAHEMRLVAVAGLGGDGAQSPRSAVAPTRRARSNRITRGAVFGGSPILRAEQRGQAAVAVADGVGHPPRSERAVACAARSSRHASTTARAAAAPSGRRARRARRRAPGEALRSGARLSDPVVRSAARRPSTSAAARSRPASSPAGRPNSARAACGCTWSWMPDCAAVVRGHGGRGVQPARERVVGLRPRPSALELARRGTAGRPG